MGVVIILALAMAGSVVAACVIEGNTKPRM
jgi:hypothetical protein